MKELTLFELNCLYGNDDNIHNHKVNQVVFKDLPPMNWNEWLQYCGNLSGHLDVYAFFIPDKKTLKVILPK
jgi:hypothetical protein